jgi:hypothetical protein
MGKTLVKIKQTDRGELEWVNIRGDGKENLQGQMQYVANLVLEGEPAENLKAQLNQFWEDNKPGHIKKAKTLGYYPHKVKTDEVDDEGDPVYEETGKTEFRFKTATTWPDGKTKVVKIMDSKNQERNVDSNIIGNGSIGRVAGAMDIYEVKPQSGKGKSVEAGVTLYLDAIKVLKLEEYTSGPEFEDDDGDFEDGWEDDGWDNHQDSEQEADKEESAPKGKGGKPRI